MSFEKTQKFFNEMSFFTLSNAAPDLGRFFKDTITISTPHTELTTFSQIREKANEMVYASIKFNEGDIGDSHIFFEEKDALLLAQYAIEKKLGERKSIQKWDELSINAIEEVVNILGGNMTEILNVIYGKEIKIDVPELKIKNEKEFQLYHDEEKIIVNTFTVRLGEEKKIKMREMAKQIYYEDLIAQLKKRV